MSGEDYTDIHIIFKSPMLVIFNLSAANHWRAVKNIFSVPPYKNELGIRITKWLKVQALKPDALGFNPDTTID